MNWYLKLRPFACVTWLFLALAILWAMSKSISVELQAHDAVKKLSIAQLMLLPYRSATHVTRNYLDSSATASLTGNHKASSGTTLSPAAPVASTSTAVKSPVPTTAANSQLSQSEPTIVLAISMPDEMGIRSWRWYEATIETLAVGVYLYATFVLTSTQFLSGNTGLTFVTIMALCSSVVRILENIFWSPR